MIYTIGGIKGGGGKTTIATNLAVLLVSLGKDVLLVDADDQESATDFTSFRFQTLSQIGYTSVKVTGETLNAQVTRLASKYDDIIIDTGGRDTISQRSAMTVSDIYIVPFVPRSFDIWTFRKVERLVSEVKTFNPKLSCFTFINRTDARGNYREEAAELLKESEVLLFLETSIGNRVSFANAAASGLGVVEVKPNDEKAIAELKSLYDEILSKRK